MHEDTSSAKRCPARFLRFLLSRFAQRDFEPLLIGSRLIQSVLDCVVCGKASRSIDSGGIVADGSRSGRSHPVYHQMLGLQLERLRLINEQIAALNAMIAQAMDGGEQKSF